MDEEEIDYDDEAGAGFMDASEMLDMGAYDSEDESVSSSASGSGSGSDASEDDDEEMDSVSSSSEVDEEYEGALDKLSSFVEGLESKKRKVDDDGEMEGGKKKKRVVLKERTEAYPEGEFVAVGAKDGEADGALLCPCFPF